MGLQVVRDGERRRWTCDGCGRIDVWGPGWQWFGALSDKRTGREPAIEHIICSAECKAKFAPEVWR